jgi:eIF-2B alpha/beta/delta-like uncharacterized protein
MDINPEILKLIEEIKSDKTHGASQLARRAAEVLKTATECSRAKTTDEFRREQQEIGERLMSIRPAMAPVFNIVSGLLSIMGGAGGEADLDSLRQRTMAQAGEAIDASLQAVARIAGHGSRLIDGGDKIMTHSYSSTVVAALKEAFNKHDKIEVIVTRSGPGRTGEQLVQELSLRGIPTTFVDDAAAGLYISTATKVIVGADRVCADGALINGIGTYLLALTAERADIPFYVLCETLKFDPRIKGSEVDLEEKDAAEVVDPTKLPSGVKVKNPYFDITPLEMVTGVVTENGLLTPEAVISYMREYPVGTA